MLSVNVPQIVDSIMALFRTDYSGRGELSERQQKVRVFAPYLIDVSDLLSARTGIVGKETLSHLVLKLLPDAFEAQQAFRRV